MADHRYFVICYRHRGKEITMTKNKNHLKEWTRHYRDDKGVWEDVCIHGVGHEKGKHGCDGCCQELYELQSPEQLRIHHGQESHPMSEDDKCEFCSNLKKQTRGMDYFDKECMKVGICIAIILTTIIVFIISKNLSLI